MANQLFDPKRLKQLEQGYQQSVAQQQAVLQQQRNTQSSKPKSFLTDQISTGGGLAGALAGGAAGTAVAPGLGTIVGALIGGFAGGGAGQIAENAYVGEQDLSKDVLKEATLNGIFGAGPIRAGSLAVRGGAALARGAGKEGLMVAGQKALVDRPIRNSIGKALSGASDNMAVKSIGATPSQLTNFQKKFGEDIVPVLNRYNLVGKGAKDLTKVRTDLDKQFGELVKGAGDVTKTDLTKAFQKVYAPMLKSASLDKQASGQAIKKQAEAILKKINKDTIPAATLNDIKREFDSLVSYTQRAADPTKYGVNKKIADVLRESVQGAPGAQGLKETGMEISKLRQLEDVLQAQGNRGRGSNPLGLISSVLAGAGGVTGGPAGAVGAMGVASALNSQTGRRLATKGLEKAGGKLAKQQNSPMGPLNVGKRVVGGNLLADALSGQSSFDNTTANINQATAMSAPMSNPSIMDSQYTTSDNQSSEPSIGGVPKSALEQAMAMAVMNGDGKAFDQLKDLYALLPEESSQKALSQGQQERADLISALDNTEAAMQGGSIEYGPIGGLTNDVRAYFNAADPETLAFKNTISGLRAAITKARAGASLTEGELRLLKQYTPDYKDSEQVVKSKLAALRQLYGYNKPQGGGGLDASSLAQALGQ